MIPILYEKDETLFVSNGLGRLRDCIRCECFEERNGVYEVEFDYPLNGQNFDKIQIGRIVAVEHDDSGDVQPFDIVSYERPIDGVVTFHCVHISYRQSYMTVTGTNINSLASAFTKLGTASPSNPFTYWTDKTSTGYVGAFDGVPKTVRSMLGGVEGSILDAYGGEYEWDKFTVKLWSQRGQYRDFAIRYGVNMMEYVDETDSSECYSSIIPYWTDGTSTVVGDKQTLSTLPPTGRDACIPMDVSEKFENKPTKAQVNTMGRSVLNSGQPYLPAQNITVSFVRLQDTPEYAQFSSLLRCGLCDTIKVIFPDYQSSGTFKIVKTVWNVLEERYDEMELGDLSISLSDALGINDMQKDSKSTIEQILDRLDNMELKAVEHTLTTSLSVSSGSSNNGTYTATKSGYYPLGVVGWRTANGSGSGGSYALAFGARVSSASTGSASVNIGIRAVGGNVTNCILYATVLWQKRTT
jgi:phage minor structural protein